jgi:hypothetical protein
MGPTRMMRLTFVVLASLLIAAIQAPTRDGPAPEITAIGGPTAAVPRYGLAEFRIALTSAATRVYYPFGPADGYTDPQGISVDAEITGPDGRVARVPAFYHTPYEIAEVDDAREALGVAGPSDWRVRYTPAAVGRHSLVVRVRDAGGEARSAAVPFDVAASDRRGFLRVNGDDPRFLRYDNGDDFLPIAEGHQWAPQERRRALSYADAFAADAASGVNLTRIWDQNDSYNLSIEGADPVWAPTWSQFSPGLAIDLVERHDGQRAARFQASAAATAGYAQWIAVRPSTRYVLSGWIRTAGLSGNGAFIAAGGNSLLEAGPDRTPVQKGTTDWAQVRQVFTTGGGERAVPIWAGAAGSTGTAWFDDLAVTAMDGSDHNVLSDPGFERHFPKADRGNDPEDPAVARTVPKGTFVNQWSAFQLDRILQAADTHGIAVQLCSHGDVYWTWDATVFDSEYATANGYRTKWTDPRHLGYWQRNYRYRIARWGYSTALLAWEVWNEHGLIEVPSEVQQFYQLLGRFVTTEDPYRHPFTTSQWSQAYSPAFWASTPTDLVNYHDYITTKLDRHAAAIAGDAAAFVYTLADGLVADWPKGTPRRPFIWGEIGTVEQWDVDDKRLLSGRGAELTRHPFLWAGLFSPALTSPIDWQAAPKADTGKAIRAFFAGEPLAAAGWETFATADLAPRASGVLQASTDRGRVMALVSTSRARVLAWVSHRDHTWRRVIEGSVAAEPVSGSFTTPPLPAGRYAVEWWNTRTGRIESRNTIDHAGGGPLRLAWPAPLATDIAVKAGRLP